MNQPENRMSEAFRRLNAMAPRGASPALGEMLKDEFQRHHARRKRNQVVRLSVLAACLAATVTISIIRAAASRTDRSRVSRVPSTGPAV